MVFQRLILQTRNYTEFEIRNLRPKYVCFYVLLILFFFFLLSIDNVHLSQVFSKNTPS